MALDTADIRQAASVADIKEEAEVIHRAVPNMESKTPELIRSATTFSTRAARRSPISKKNGQAMTDWPASPLPDTGTLA